MADVSELSKLKVPELKKMLKAKGLSIVGTKADLISRLSMEEQSKDEVTTSLDSTLDDDEDDATLDDTTDKSLNGADEAQTTVSTTVSTTVKLTKKDTNAEPAPEPKFKKIEMPTTAKTTNGKLEERLKRFGGVSEEVKKTVRADRFQITTISSKPAAPAEAVNSPVKSTKLSSALVNDPELLKKRAQRFASSEITTSVKPNESNTTDVLQKRAQRFGSNTSDKSEKIVKVSAASPVKVDEQSAILKRKARFSAVVAPTSGVEAKKLKGAERFSASS